MSGRSRIPCRFLREFAKCDVGVWSGSLPGTKDDLFTWGYTTGEMKEHGLGQDELDSRVVYTNVSN